VVASFERTGTEVATLLHRARTLPRVSKSGIVVSTDKLLARIDRGSFALHGETSLVFRVEGASGAAHVEERHAVVDDASGAQTLVFDRGAAVELLHRLPKRAPLAYTLDLPAGHALRRTEDGAGGTVEVLDGAGIPRVRLTADGAWDRDGRAFQVRLAIAGNRVEVQVPEGVAYPIVIDPAWSATSLPTRLRSGHTATLLPNAEVLLAGGGTSTAEVYETTTGRFRSVGAMSVKRPGHSAAVLNNGTVLIIGGTTTTSTEIYNPATGMFSAGPSMLAITGGTRAVRLPAGQVLVTTGTVAEKFDSTTSTWTSITKKTSADGRPVPLSNGNVLYVGDGVAELYRSATNDFAAIAAPAEISGLLLSAPTSTGALLYGFTGVATSTGSSFFFTKGTWTFDTATSTFTKRADVASPSIGALGTGLPSGKVLFIGAQAQSYDPATNAWSAGESLPQDQDGGTATVLPSGSVLVAGGSSGGATVYLGSDPGGPGTYTATGALGAGRINGRMTRLHDGRVFFAGGTPAFGADGRKTAEVWSASTGTWTSAGALLADRIGHAQVLLPSGKVLLAGGGALSSAEIFNPATTTSTATASLSVARDGASATMLPTGKILVAGGSGKSTAEIFDESKGTFTVLTSTMSAAHANHGAVLLPNGRVIVIDGDASELFDPSTETFTPGPTLSAARDGRTASLLSSGDIVVGGRSMTLPLERYESATNTFALAGPMVKELRGQSAAPLPFGRVLFGFGLDGAAFSTRSESWVFELLGEGGRGGTAANASAPLSRADVLMTQLATGGIMVAGGNGCAGGCFGDPSVAAFVFEPRGPAMAQRPAITTVPSSVTPGAVVDLVGTRFVGTRETSSSSSTRLPIFVFVPASGQGSVVGSTLSFTDTTAKVRFPAMAFRGKGFIHASVAGVTGPGALVDIGPAVNGTACKVSADCSSSNCVDGVCCDTKCEGVCVACTKERKGSGVDGTCGAIPPEKDAKDACALFQGAPCASDAQCATGICADGVCCDARCEGQCEACSAEGSVGTCVPVLGAPKGSRPKCDAGTDVCNARQCDGATRASCEGYAPATTNCRPGSCGDGTETLEAKCDGKGACPAPATKSCEPFACGDDKCLSRCTADSECTASYRCVAGKCVTGAFCATDRVLKTPGAPDVDCSPFTCEGERCKSSCGSSLDCVGGFLCSDGKCVAAALTGPAADEGSGCVVSGTGRSGSAVALGLLALMGALGRARRRLAR